MNSRVLSFTFLAGFVLSLPALSASAVLIGDSLSVGPFGGELFSCLRDSRLFKSIKSEASCSGRINHWSAKKPSFVSPVCYTFRSWIDGQKEPAPDRVRQVVRNFEQLSRGTTPDEDSWTVIQLGTNHFHESPASIEAQADALLATRKTEKCLLVLPPGAASGDQPKKFQHKTTNSKTRQSDVAKALRSAAIRARCVVHDSTQQISVDQYNSIKGDGLHFDYEEGTALAKSWARAVCQTVKNRFEKTEKRPAIPRLKAH